MLNLFAGEFHQDVKITETFSQKKSYGRKILFKAFSRS
jgi:hypothetical protein